MEFESLQPFDTFNQVLKSNVHPSDYVNPKPAGKYNLVVIGAGPAGLVAAAGAAGLGAKVALVERGLMGGDCLNVGCVPSKALIRAARACAAIRNASTFGIDVPDGVRFDFKRAMERMRRLRSEMSAVDSTQRFKSLGVDVFLGQASFLDSETVGVEGARLKFAKAVIATGARAAAPAIRGLKDVPYLTNETLFSLTELPPRFGVIGAGPIGAEMAQAFARFGSKVTLVCSHRGLLPREDRDATAMVQRALEHDGVNLVPGSHDLNISRDADGAIRMVYTHSDQGYDVDVDQLLIATGRAPNVEGLGLDKVGVEYTPHGVTVNDRLQTTHSKIFAAGDICSPHRFTHAADFMARAVIRNALFRGRSKFSSMTIPRVTFTSPELAHIGLTRESAEQQGIAVDTFDQSMGHVDRAILDGETNGLVRIHVRRGTDRIVGATVVAENAGDMIGELALAMTNRIGLSAIANTIHPYPTQAEAIRKTGDAYARTRLTPMVARVFKKWLEWTR